MVNVNKLKGKIVECGTNISEIAERIGIDKTTLYRKLASEGRNITLHEAQLIANTLGLTAEEVNSIFFASNVA